MTDVAGWTDIVYLYTQGKKYTNQTLELNLEWLRWIDANWCALLSAVLYKLQTENSLKFVTDIDLIRRNFNVLLRNQFIQSDSHEDDRQTTIPSQFFLPKDKTNFLNYIEQKLLEHRGMPELTPTLKDQIKSDIIEIFCNIEYHAKTSDPFFICGQFYPLHRTLKLTMVDLGVGFLPAIREVTKGSVMNNAAAIQWALNGNTSKPNVPGGLGIQGIYKYCKNTNGNFQIVTGSAFWDLASENNGSGVQILDKEFFGTTINLFFNCN